MTFFWLLLLAHATADFILQTDAVSLAKCRLQWRGFLYHGLGVFLCTLFAVHFFGWWTAAAAAGLVTLTHLSLDWLYNSFIHFKTKRTGTTLQPGLAGFLLDQLLHIYILLWVWHLLDKPADLAVAGFYQAVFLPVYDSLRGLDSETAVPLLAVFVMVGFGGAPLVRKTLDRLFPHGTGFKEDTSAGKYIGILERMLIMILAAFDALTAIGFVFAAKSLARFNAISEDRRFAEYYIIGTLLSFFLALVAGLFLRNLLSAL